MTINKLWDSLTRFLKTKLKRMRMVTRVKADLPPEPEGWWLCDMCNKWLPLEAQCNYDWSGTCTTSQFVFQRDHPPVISARSDWK